MVTYVKMPKLSRAMEEGIVGKWHKKVGDKVSEGEILCEIETEKAVDELKAPDSGILRRIMSPEGSAVKVNEAIAIIAGADELLPEKETTFEKPDVQPTLKDKYVGVSTIERPATAQPKEIVKVSPVARKLVKEHGINLEGIVGTGPCGRIVRDDVQKLIARGEKVKTVPLTRMRQIIKNRLDYSVKTALHVPLTIEVDMTNAVELVRKAKQEAENVHDKRVTPTGLLVKAVAKSLVEHPIVNSRLVNDQVEMPEEVNVGVAVAIEDGLVVPVIHNADKKSLREIAKTITSLSEKARSGSLSTEESTGGTFTVSNLGMFGIDLFAPIINPPESAILGVGRVVKKPVVIDDKIEIRSMITLTLVFDHRIMDGAVAAQFLQTLKCHLENLDFFVAG